MNGRKSERNDGASPFYFIGAVDVNAHDGRTEQARDARSHEKRARTLHASLYDKQDRGGEKDEYGDAANDHDQRKGQELSASPEQAIDAITAAIKGWKELTKSAAARATFESGWADRGAFGFVVCVFQDRIGLRHANEDLVALRVIWSSVGMMLQGKLLICGVYLPKRCPGLNAQDFMTLVKIHETFPSTIRHWSIATASV